MTQDAAVPAKPVDAPATVPATAPSDLPDEADPYAVPDGPHPHGDGIREDGPTLSGLPDHAPDELRATLSGGDPDQLPVEDDARP